MHIRLIIFYFVISFPVLSCELNVRLEQYTPESFKSIKGNWFGVDMELTHALFSEANCKFRVFEVSWARSLAMLAKGEIDMVLNMSKTTQRENLFYFIGPIREETIVLATNKNIDLNITNIEDLADLKKPIAVQRHAYYGEHIQRLINDKKYAHMFITVTDNATKIAQLNRGRIIGFLEAKRNIVHGIKHNVSFKNISYQPFVFHQNPVYFALSKQSINHALYLKIKAAFEQLLVKGTISKITK